jgi:hypothetical protein
VIQKSSAVEAVTASRTGDAALVQPIDLLLLASEVALRHRVGRRVVLGFLGGGLLADCHIKLHSAIRHCGLALLETIPNALLRQGIGVGRLALALIVGLLFWSGAAGDEQDNQITHVGLPFINYGASIYFFPKNGLTNGYERFGAIRK